MNLVIVVAARTSVSELRIRQIDSPIFRNAMMTMAIGSHLLQTHV